MESRSDVVAEQADILTCLANKAGQIMIPLQILRGALPLTEWRTATCTHQRFLSLIRLSNYNYVEDSDENKINSSTK
ncbi:hypothetical protein LG34_10825 [Eubacterium ramulus]|uniref:Uncharacterized protein n=1 Tax=Eubacterium ramulus TaxID=39490 RepID=A0A2V1JND5_EUBRA|nr:hypothetical protein LG34_10825 [Eubacterium ramulus]